MSFVDVFLAALRGLLANKLRSILTTLGVFIGVSSVILLIGVGQGAAVAVQSQLSELGTNTLTISPSGESSPVRDQRLTTDTVAMLSDRALAPDVEAVTPQVSTSATASNGRRSGDASVTGTTASYFATTNSRAAYGSTFTAEDVTSRARVAMLSEALADKLFGDAADAVGGQVTVGGASFTVVGVKEKKDSDAYLGSADAVYAPLTTVQDTLTGYGAVDQITIKARSAAAVKTAGEEVKQILNLQLHVTAADVRDDKVPYRVDDSTQLLQSVQQVTLIFTVVLGAIAAISLVVGGIGITNIMLVSVTERTREIGIRKALGAPRRVILGQFLVESVLVSLVGGVLGVLVGLLGSLVKVKGFGIVVTPGSVVLALGVSMVVGLFFGGYPANRAAKLQPIEALRHE